MAINTEKTEKSAMAQSLDDWMEKAQVADDGKPGKSLSETSTEELKETLAKLKPTDPGAEARISALKAELKKRGGEGMDKGCGEEMDKAKQPSQSTSLSPEKARQMLHEGSGGHGRPITEQQRKFFGAVGGHLPAPGSKAKKSMAADLGDWLEKAGPFIGPKGGKWADAQHTIPWKAEGGGGGGEAASEAKPAEAGPTLGPKEEAAAKVAAKYGAKPIWSKQPGGMIGLQFSGEDAKKLMDAGYQHLGKLSSGNYSTMPSYLAKFEPAGEAGGKSPKLLHPGSLKPGMSLGKWKIKSATDKRVTIFMPGDLGSKLDKPLTFNYDGTGFKRQGRYLTPDGGSLPASDFQKSLEQDDDSLEKAGPYVGPKGGKYADPQHKTPWKEETPTAKPGGPEDFKPTKLEPQDQPEGAKPKPAKAAKAKKLSDTHAKVLSSASKFQTVTPGGSFATYKQVDKLVENGLLEAAGRGQYKLTDAGKEALNTGKFAAPMKKSEVAMSLEGWLEKSGGLPTHEPKLGASKSASVEGGSADGGEVAGVGMTSGSSDSAPGPGQDGQGQLKGVSPGGKEKLSEDDAEESKQMTPHTKPIETIRKSRFPADQRASVAHETAVEVSRLHKSDDVYVGASIHPLSHVLQHGHGDDAASELVKSEGFYHGRSPQTARPSVMLGQGVLCKSVHAGGCDAVYTAALTACPDCGAGTVGHRALPGGVIMGAEEAILEKSQGHGNLLRPRPEEPDIKIGE